MTDQRESGAALERRTFMGAATLGFISLASATLRPAMAQAPDASDAPAKPAGVKPRAMFDCRFPDAYQASVPAAMAVLTQYFAALASRDLKAVAKCLHFPFAIYEGIEAIVVESEANMLDTPPPSMNVKGTLPEGLKGHGGLTIRKGSYDMLDVLQLHTFNPVNVGLELVFSRYDAGGEKLEVCQGIYGITKNEGRWAIQMASTIYTPANQTGVDYRDAAEFQLRSGRDWMMGWSESDGELLSMRGSSPGKHASIGGGTGGGPAADNFLRSAETNTPMELYASKGVKSRLAVRGQGGPERQGGGERGNAQGYSPDRFTRFDRLAAGGVGKYGYTMVLPNQRVLHARVDKAHTFGGYIRYTPESVMISETRSLGIITYKHGKWGSAGGFGQSMYRDRTNDAL